MLWQGHALETALEGGLSGLDQPSDRALARAIASTTLRWLADLDALIDSATATPLPADARARMTLRLALAQVLCLATPPHAAVATALPLVEKGPRRLVHGVISTLLRRGVRLPAQPTIPAPYGTRWAETYGVDACAGLAAALAHEPPTDLSLRNPAEAERWAAAVGGEVLAPGTLRTTRKGAVTDWPGFDEGAWWVQDFAASLPARLLGDVAGARIVDLCAAPGGKTLQLAAAGAAVTAVDISNKRLARLADNLARTRLSAEAVVADARKWAPAGAVDHVLLDAPCSASGIFRRHPDVLHLKGTRDLAPLLEIQTALLERAVEWLPAHGRLVYCVCSLEPEEGEHQVTALLARRSDVRLDPIRSDELPQGIHPRGEGWVRTIPGDLDGFFIARLARG